MSVDERLRTGLAANTEHLRPNLDQKLALLRRRVHRRSLARRGGYGLTAAVAATAAVLWLPGAIDAIGGMDGPVDPVVEPLPTFTVLEVVDDFEALPPGSYAMTFTGAGADGKAQAVVEVASPDYRSNGNFLISGAADDQHAIGLWTVATVTADPCTANTRLLDPGPTVQDLATALAEQPLKDGSDPVPVSIGGYEGLYVETSVPTGIDFNECVNDIFASWHTDQGFVRAHHAPGEVDRLWILDVEGDRLVVGASHTPGTSSDHIAELTHMVESITFTNPDQPRQ